MAQAGKILELIWKYFNVFSMSNYLFKVWFSIYLLQLSSQVQKNVHASEKILEYESV